MNKQRHLFLAMWLIVWGGENRLQSQVIFENGAPKPDTLQKSFQVDFAIPDAPAFKLLNSEPSSILRPTTVRELTTTFSNFVQNGSSLTIPNAIAIEFSPGLLVSGQTLSLDAYRKLDWWYRLRVSGATLRRTDGRDRKSVV